MFGFESRRKPNICLFDTHQKLIIIDSNALLLICYGARVFVTDSQPEKRRKPSQSRYYPSSNVFWYLPDRREFGCGVSDRLLYLLVVRWLGEGLSSFSSWLSREGTAPQLGQSHAAWTIIFEGEGRGGLDYWLPYSKMSPASRSYVNGIFAVFYLKKGSVLYLTQTIWYAKMANVCAFLMAFFASAVYLDELTNCFKSEACSNSPWMLVMRDEKRIARGFEPEILYFATQFQY